jgi:hypothetical protein
MRECRYGSTTLDLGIRWKWSASGPARFNQPGKALSTDWIGGRVGPRTGLDDVENAIFSVSLRESNPISSVFHSVNHRYTD